MYEEKSAYSNTPSTVNFTQGFMHNLISFLNVQCSVSFHDSYKVEKDSEIPADSTRDSIKILVATS